MENQVAFLQTMNDSARVMNEVAEAHNQRKHETTEAEKARAFEYDMWQIEKAYNTPIAQVQRLREAGINPAAVYGTVAKNNTTDTSHMSYHKVPYTRLNITPIDVLGIADSIMNLRAKELDQKQRQMEMTRQNQLLGYQVEAARLDNVMKQEDLSNKYNLSKAQIKKIEQEYKFNDSVNQHRLRNWNMFGTDEAPWYLKFGNNLFEGIKSSLPSLKMPWD